MFWWEEAACWDAWEPASRRWLPVHHLLRRLATSRWRHGQASAVPHALSPAGLDRGLEPAAGLTHPAATAIQRRAGSKPAGSHPADPAAIHALLLLLLLHLGLAVLVYLLVLTVSRCGCSGRGCSVCCRRHVLSFW